MSSQKHIIHRQVIEVEVPSVEGAWPIQNRLSDSYKYNLMQVLEDVFDSIAGPDQVLRIDKLEIDLGEINVNSIEEEMSSRLRELVTEKLAQLKLKAEGRSGDDSEELSLRKRPLQYTPTDFLFHFLRTGTAPWWHDRNQFGTVKEVFLQMLEKQPDILRAFLPKLLRNPVVRKRIAAVFEDRIIEKLILVFKPAHALFSLTFLRQIAERQIGIRIANTVAGETHPGKKKKTAENSNSVLPQAEARSQWIGHLLLAVQEQNIEAIESFFSSYEIVSDKGPAASHIVELKKLALAAGIKIAAIKLAETDEYFNQKSVSGKSKRIRRKRTRENLHTEEELVEDTSEDFASEDESRAEEAGFSDERSEDLLDEAESFTDEQSGEGKRKKDKRKKTLRQKKTLRNPNSGLAGETESIGEQFGDTETKTATAEIVPFEMIDPEKEIAETKKKLAGAELLQKTKEEDELPVLLSEEELSDFIVDNAGLVLVWPYLSFFFDALGMLQDRRFVNEAAASRAVHLLQYIADNGEFEYEEHDLVLNKILCGIEITRPVDMNFEITEAEKEEVEGLLQAVRDNWKAIGTTSVNGMRMAFIRKEGSLKKTDQGWTLQIERATIDMLLDKLPWAISIIRLPWTQELLYVEW